ncbi:MAG: F0F1 ATP synthase subunit gamma, partial [Sphingomonadales bacterium GWF1_63_6]
EAARPYSSRLEAVVASLASKIAGGSGEGASPLLAGTGKDEVHLLVVANSDRGLAGAFNANIVKAARVKADALIEQGKTVKFYLIGRKGRPVINRLYPGAIVAQFDTTGAKQPGYDQAQAIANELTTMYLDGKFDMAHLFYSRFKSALSQIPTEQQIIPVKIPADADRNAIGATVEYEPSEEAILDDLLPRNIAIQLFKALLENNASEQGASMNAMDNATRNAGDLINKLTIQYNRSRQAAITTELVEIISGAEAL